jgi:lipoate-protein ligase A
VLVTPPADGAWNMAVDAALLDRARSAGDVVVRVYEWSRPTLSLGRNQTARGHYDLPRANALGVGFVRRPTGGRAVLHHRELTYSVTSPAAVLGGLREAYARINSLLVAALHTLGVDASIAPRTRRAPTPGLAPCFDLPGEGELTARGRKLAGSAQWRDAHALLQHGSILVEDDQALATALLRQPGEPSPAAAALRDLLGHVPTAHDLAAALQHAIVTMEDPGASPLVMDSALERRIAVEREHFMDEQWTWRR